ncbi:MAG: SDR family oxidoreductase [Betaproteobacteria bacterium]|nr:SDR family oxidoreductase [Betaproteobacteria bacterium]MDH3438662.1 SDR family oxidoreductase [Betaproteobacteria bacterium]
MSAPGSLPGVLNGCRLDGRVALVTGAGRGLGLAAAIGLAQAGAEVLLVSRTLSDLEEAADTIRSDGGAAQALVCDVTNGAQVREAFAQLPRLDILVNNAGGNLPEPFVEVTEERLDRILNLNVRAAFLVAQAAARKMLETADRRQRGGAMVNVSSQMGHVGAAGRTVYCMTKHALEGLTKALAVELAPHNIRVNSIAPTFIETPMTAPFFEEPRFREWVLNRIPLGRLGKLDEVSAAVAFLASPAASLITGTSLLVDGGWTAQ